MGWTSDNTEGQRVAVHIRAGIGVIDFCVSSFVVTDCELATGGSFTGVTVSTNVSLILTGVPLIVFVTVTVIVVVPFLVSRAGVIVSLRVDAVSLPTTTLAFRDQRSVT